RPTARPRSRPRPPPSLVRPFRSGTLPLSCTGARPSCFRSAMTLTPMMRQYREAKERHPGMFLFFRNGDFYELFEEDAELGSRLLGITLTKRDKEIPMAGVPHHALERYLAKLLQAGHRVAICDQIEDASQAKGIIRREVT